MKKIIIIAVMSMGVVQAWTFPFARSKERAVDLPKGSYSNDCLECKATQDEKGEYTLQCTSCSNSNGQYFGKTSITYSDSYNTFSTLNGKLVKDSPLKSAAIHSSIK